MAQYAPTRRGFEEYFGILTGGGGHFSHVSDAEFTMRGTDYKTTSVKYSGFNLWHNGNPVADSEELVFKRHSTDIYADVAKAQLTAAVSSTQPFFAYLSFQAVHAPMEVPSDYVDGTVDNGCAAINGASKRQTLCGMLSQLDAAAARLVAHLKSDAMGNAWAKTVFVFLSDNGGIEEHGSSNMPFRGGKGTYYEGGLRVPAFIAGGFTESSLAAAGTAPFAATGLMHISDLHATILGLASAPFTSGDSSAAAMAVKGQALAADAAAPTGCTGTFCDPSPAAASSTALRAEVPVLDGVDQWAHLIGGAANAAFAPRTSLLHNANTDAFGAGGALRVGDYKLLVTPKVSETEVFAYGQHVLQDGDFDASDLAAVLGKKLLRGEGTYQIFNIAKNPNEREDGACDDLEECSSLYGNGDFRQVEIALMDAWKGYRATAAASTLAWADDGPLADPKLFGGFWAAWRDELGMPYATYATTSAATSKFDEATGAPVAGTGAGEDAAAAAAAPAGDKTWKAGKAPAARAAVVPGQQAGEELAASSSGGSGDDGAGGAHPALLVGAGSVVGALAAVAVMSILEQRRGQRYSPVETDHA